SISTPQPTMPAVKPAHARWVGPPLPLPKPSKNQGRSAIEGQSDNLISLMLPQLSYEDRQVYRAAFKAIEQERWDEAYRLAQQGDQASVNKLINWLRLTKADSRSKRFADITAFLDKHRDWPGQRTLRRAAETTLPDDLADQMVVDWFRANPPQTLDGTKRYADALLDRGLTDEARTAIRQRWIDGPVPSGQQRAYLKRYGTHLVRADHSARVDRLIWGEHYDAAEAMLRHLPKDEQLLHTARLRLAEQSPGVDAAIRRVPAHLRNDPGLVFERARWRRKRDLNEGAAELLTLAAEVVPGRDDKPQVVWWAERDIMARRMLDAGIPGMAYKIAADHDFEPGLEFANLEWLSGWIALRVLDKPQLAAAHFKQLYDNVTTPISLARGSYWAGRAAQSMQDADAAFEWYAIASGFNTTFYGQLAANRLQRLNGQTTPAVLDLREEPEVDRERRQAFSRNEFVRLVSALDQIGDNASTQVPIFMSMLRKTAADEDDYRMIGELAMALKRPSEAIKTAKEAAKEGFQLAELGYPQLNFRTEPIVETSLIHAMIRQESGFNPLARSRVGALGLMQLMPATAQQVARESGRPHNTTWLLTRPDHNVLMGMLYMNSLLRRFDGSYVLAVAAYNAGPTRVEEWIEAYGDPRLRAVDVLDWIERIPYRETRNYVQRVLEATQVYRARLAGGKGFVTLDNDLLR
ncbi:MAG: lytic transglycosylase domain-containing protein, partial [Pseudomonadota bacterium]